MIRRMPPNAGSRHLCGSGTFAGMRTTTIAVALALSLLAAACGSDEPTATIGDVDPLAAQSLEASPVVGTAVGDLSMPDVSNDGAPFAMQANPGEVLVMYFGFTFCPDICPTTLWDLSKAIEAVGNDADRITVAMATIDPERDTPDVLDGYLSSFVDGGHALRTTDQSLLDEFAAAFGGDFDVVKGADGQVEVFHTAYLYAVDDQGTIKVVWPFGAEAEKIADDLSSLLG